MLLCPAADSPQWTGLLQRGLPGEVPRTLFRYEVIRVWHVPVEQLLAGGIGTLALAPISAVAEGEIRDVIRSMKERLSGERALRRAADVWAATYVLLGLRYSDALAHALFREVGSLTATNLTNVIPTPAGAAPPAADGWFLADVVVQGQRVTVKVNGKTVAEFVDEKKQFAGAGHIALHQDINAVIEFRKVEIKALAAAP